MTRRRLQLVALFLITMVGVRAPGIAGANDKCGLNTLHGLYVFSATGFITPPAPATLEPKAVVELIRFHGDGTLEVPAATASINGMIIRAPGTGTGTYTLAQLMPPDRACVGSLSFLPSGPHFDVFVALDGQEIWMIQNDSNTVLQGKVVKLTN